jgi:hypothetical protein
MFFLVYKEIPNDTKVSQKSSRYGAWIFRCGEEEKGGTFPPYRPGGA